MTLDDIKAQIEAETTIVNSVVGLINGLEQQIKDAAGDQAKIDAIFAEAKANADALSAAVTANTPSTSIVE